MLKRRRDAIKEAPARVGTTTIEPPLGSPRKPGVEQIGELLITEGALDFEALDGALTLQTDSGRKLGELLLDQKLISPQQLLSALSKQFKIPMIDVRVVEPSPEALAMVAESVARNLEIIPITLSDNTLSLVIADPVDPRLPGVLRAIPVATVRVYLASATDVRESINSWYKALAGIGDFVRDNIAATPAARIQPLDETPGGVDAPVIEVVNRLVAQALRDRASDIHLEPAPDSVRVRYRIDGSLHDVVRLPSTIGPAMISRLKIMADMNIVEKRRPQDGQFQTIVDGRELDVRVATTPTIFGEKAVLRLLDKGRSLFDLVDLGMPADLKQNYDRIVKSPFGMVVVAGPTGSGKTTTLYATLAQISRPELNVTTIEDPVEYIFPDINQIEINVQSGLTFAVGLRSILRQDPDIILLGEVRDVETARIAVQSALTGHLVLSSLHATDATSALFRLLDMGIERFLVASALTGVVAQRLLRRICTSCAVAYTPAPQELDYYDEAGGREKSVFMHGAGCSY